MTVLICDPFQVRRLEKILKRPLTETERSGETPVRVRDADGRMKFEYVRRYNMRDFYSK